jgi:hypothetical protein
MKANLRQKLVAIARFSRRVASFLAECDHAQRSMLADMIMPGGCTDRAPHTYAEFLFRTSGPLPREPTAALRSRGEPVARARRWSSSQPR